MNLYDGASDVNFFYYGTLTRAEISENPYLADLVSVPCVLYDDGVGRVYRFDRLDVLADRYGVDMTDNPEQTFASVLSAMEEIHPDRAEQALEIAETAQQVADEAKEIASQAGTDPQVMAFARMAVLPMAATMTDEQAISVSTLWPEWSADGVQYKADDVVQYAGHLYRCEQAHTSQADWTPDAAPSLWSKIDIAGDGVDVWTQPTGAHNAYNTGDRVHYPTADDPIYVSTIDGNVWAPDAYPQGWKLEQAE